MIRTQLYLPTDLHHQIMQLAKQQAKPMAEIVRNFISQGLQRSNIDQSGKNTLLALSKLNIQGGPTDLSQNLDQYLYGGKL
jgi:hypothetical protein